MIPMKNCMNFLKELFHIIHQTWSCKRIELKVNTAEVSDHLSNMKLQKNRTMDQLISVFKYIRDSAIMFILSGEIKKQLV